MLLSSFVADISAIKTLAFVLMGLAGVCMLGLVFSIILHVRSQAQLEHAHRLLGKMLKNQGRLFTSLTQALEGQKRTHALLDAIMSNTMDLATSTRHIERRINSKSTSNANNSVVVNGASKYEEALFNKLGEERRRIKEELDMALMEIENHKLINQDLVKQLKAGRHKS